MACVKVDSAGNRVENEGVRLANVAVPHFLDHFLHLFLPIVDAWQIVESEIELTLTINSQMNRHVNDLGLVPCLKLLGDLSNLLLDVGNLDFPQLVQGGLIDGRVQSRVDLCPDSSIIVLDCRVLAIAELKHKWSARDTPVAFRQIDLGYALQDRGLSTRLEANDNDCWHAHLAHHVTQPLARFVIDVQNTADLALEPLIQQILCHTLTN